MNDKVLQFLGMARRANALSLGHDAALDAVLSKKAKLCIIASDASQRLEREFGRASENKIGLLRVPYTMEEIHHAVGFKAGVMTVNDLGFANAVQKMCLDTQGGISL